MKTLLETLQGGTAYLEKGATESPRLCMELLLAHVLDCERMQLYIDFDRPMEEHELAPLRDLLKRRRAGEPLQHLIGDTEFYGRTFASDARGLVPRPETEELIELALKTLTTTKPATILDLGCGSGVIGLTLAMELEETTVTLADVSPDALALAKENTERHELESRTTLVPSDMFSGLTEQKFDAIFGNLPYIPTGELGALSKEVQHDPKLALDGGPDGIAPYRIFATGALQHLTPCGHIFLEIGDGQGEAICKLLTDAGLLEAVSHTDLAKNERFVTAVSP